MRTIASRQGGRPPLITLDDVVAIGRDLGMRRLSINAVASRLGVTATALYRYVEGRWDLERLVGESLLAELDLRDDPTADTAEHLLSFAVQLRDFTAGHPGLATYLQVLFPRGDAGRRLLAAEVAALSRRGYSAEAAILLSSAVATLVISLAAREESNAGATGGDHATGFEAERDAIADRLAGDPQLGAAHGCVSQVSNAEFVRLLLAASIRGLVTMTAPGRPIDEVVAELSDAGKDR
ncbi:TetR/AcrR family transcriptional regulator [Mycobacterium sp.]|uniref:TetR/AcrR family transcriptional regulator n=1 Tax=Mycobacterium sp. TaxID=1785 RepID=UPI0025ECF47B|nr:TetR/AcrR family transcriptional regulator [Mycobacterium sp.]